MNYAPGTRVIIRDEEWLIKTAEPVSTKGYCLDVIGISPYVKDKEARFLTDLEEQLLGEKINVVDSLKTELTLDKSGNFEDTRLYLETLLRNTPVNGKSLSIGPKGAMDLIPFQTDPAKLALQEPRCRILISDAVGLGKTIEAGILMSELMARGRGKRILVVALKSMLTQFQKEMWSRFSIPLVRLDSAGITRIKNKIPANYNPFLYYDKTIISIDTLKRETEYRYWLENSFWDIIVVDEAHNVAQRAGQSQRYKLADRLASRCDSLIMLSATPHDGRKESFASLMTMLNPAAIDTQDYGPDDIKGMFIRRFKKDIKDQVSQAFPEREIQNHRITASSRENEIFYYLKNMQYAHTVRHGRSGKLLFKTVLEKSLLSSPAACLATVQNRLKRLQLDAAKFAENSKEIQELDRLKTLLEDLPEGQVAKWNMLKDLLKSKDYAWNPKAKDDRLVIFTERIETMKYLQRMILQEKILKENQLTLLYGGMSDMDVQQTVEDFGKEASPLRLMIASDIAAEGINLHYLSHRMIHFDIPWSLMTFQQRNGRIDRYGQENKPLISYLLTDYEDEAGKGDRRILELLINKDKQVQENIGDPGEFTGIYDAEDEELRVGQAIEAGQEDLVLQTEEPEEDFFSQLFGETPALPDFDSDDTKVPRIFSSDYDYYQKVLHRLASRLNLQYEVDDQQEVLSINPIKSFKIQEKFLPDKVIPDNKKNETYRFTSQKSKVMEDIALARKEEDLWPQWNLLWDQHPLLNWLRNDLETLFGRNETPLAVGIPGLKSDEILVLFYGQIPNKRGLTVINCWKGLLFQNRELQEVLDMDRLISKLELHRNNHPNRAEERETESFKKLLPVALEKAKEILAEERESFNRESGPYLVEHQQKLSAIRDKKVRQLKLEFEDAINRGQGREFDQYQQSKERADKDFHQYLEWIQNHIETEEEGYIQFAALFTGHAATQGGLF